MSHFTVLVIGENPEEQLAPYQENNMGDCPREHLEFNDMEDEYRAEFDSESSEMVVLPDGERICKYDKRVWRQEDEKDLLSPKKLFLPDGAKIVAIPNRERYASFETYVEDYHGRKARDPEKGRYGYWENPNAKWDWYSLGGRWTGFFKLKEGRNGGKGRPGIMTSPAPAGYADQAKKGDIDIEGMMAEKGAAASEQYRSLQRLFGGAIPRVERTWQSLKDDASFGEDWDARRKLYHEQTAIVALQELRKREDLPRADRDRLFFLELDDYQCSEDEYIQRARDRAIQTFAVLKDEKWHERGSMGWWGAVSDEKDMEAWEREFAALIKGLPDDTLLSVYDCHI
jgi:hypothetical protein